MTSLNVDGFDHHFVHTGDERIHVVQNGYADAERETVLLIHGWPQTWYSWHQVMPMLSAAGYHVIAVDMRGSGDSSKPLDGYDSITVATEINDVMRQLGVTAAHVVGHDNGARVGFAYAASFSSETTTFAFLESKLLGLTDPHDVTKEYWHFGFHQADDLPELLTAGREREYLTWFYTRYSYDPTSFSRDAIDEYVRCYSALGGMRAGFGFYRAFPESGIQHRRLADTPLPMPVLALGGSHCMGTIPIDSMRFAAPHVTGGVLDNCGHWIPEERPEILVDHLRELFGQASPHGVTDRAEVSRP